MRGDNMRFSQRKGYTPIKIEIQRESMDNNLRVSLWNVIKVNYFHKSVTWIYNSQPLQLLFFRIWVDFYKFSLDTLSDYFDKAYKNVSDKFFKFEWYEVYDFIEFIAKAATSLTTVNYNNFSEQCNLILERENSAYRLINKEIVEITDENEIKMIEDVLMKSSTSNLEGVKTHLSSALSLLSDRKNPDFRNSIKESISAVESIAKIISGDSKAQLGKALKIIEDSIGIHPALKKGFSAIYGYTSDEAGIRHAMLEEKDIYNEDARYMLVACSAFINYLIIKAEKANLLKNE